MTWNVFNTLFAKACPSVSFVEEGHAYLNFVLSLIEIEGWISL